MSSSTFQFFHPLAIRGFSVRSEGLPRPLVMPEYLRLEERERLVTLLLTCLRQEGIQSGNLIRLTWKDRQLLQLATGGSGDIALFSESQDLLWLVLDSPVEETELFQFVDLVEALTLIDLRFPGGSEYVQWLAVLKTELLSAIQHSWERHAKHPEAAAVNFRRAGAWFEAPTDVLDYCNEIAAGLFSGHSLTYVERLALSNVLAARGAVLAAASVKALLLYVLRERPEFSAIADSEDTQQPDFPSHFSEWRAAGLGWIVGEEFTPLPALERLAEVELLTLFVGHWPRENAANEELHQLREKLQQAFASPKEMISQRLLVPPEPWRPSVPLNPNGTCGTSKSIRATITPLFPNLPPTADDAYLQQALMDESHPPQRHLLLAWRATLWLEHATAQGLTAILQAESAVARSLQELWTRLNPRSDDPQAVQAALIWAQLRCVLADRLVEQARVADATRLIPQALEHFTLALEFFQDLKAQKYEAEVLQEMARLAAQQGDTQRALALWPQALAVFEQIKDLQGRAATLSNMAWVIAKQGEVEKAQALWEESLVLESQIGDVSGKAATLQNMAVVAAQQGELEQALRLWKEVIEIKEQIGDVQGTVVTLTNMAGVSAQQRDLGRAFSLLQEALTLAEQIGDVQGKAATLHGMAGVVAQQGNLKRALELWQESLLLKDQIGDIQGKAATLAQMAWAVGQIGDRQEKRRLNLEAASVFAHIRAWLDLVTVLGNLGVGEDAEAAGFLAQALWLTLRVGVPLKDSVDLAAALVMKLGPAAEAAPLVAAGAVFFAHTRGERHPEREKYQRGAFNLLVACAGERGIATQEAFDEWVEREGLVDRERFVPRLDAALVALVGEQEWLFERALFGN